MKPVILVTDGEQRAALAIVRSLGRSGHSVYVCSSRSSSIGGASRFARAQAQVPDALENPSEFVAEVSRLVREWKIQCVLPVSEPSVLAVLDARQSLGGTTIPFPPLDVFRRVSDKGFVAKVAHEVGIATPSQQILSRRQDLPLLLEQGMEFPLVVKPNRSIAEGKTGRVKLNVIHASTAVELRAAVADLPDAAFPLLLQQRVVGPGVGIFLLLWQDQRLATFAHRRIREKPPSGGVSVYRESIPAEATLVTKSEALLRRLDWEGVAMVEYKVDSSTMTPYLMEINGRFWGSLQLAVDSGVDFPNLLIRAAFHGPFPPDNNYRTGVRTRWWWGDVDQLLARLRHSSEALALPPDAPTRVRSILDFLVLWRPGDHNEIFRWDDPLPIVRESIDWFARR
jgi:predicted ATP-grasp superfamily ATP-dependent carboligase